MQERLLEIGRRLNTAKIIVAGDVMLDRYWWGRAQRISPEAPVPVVLLQNRTATAGGAANVAANAAGLGAKPFLVGVTGADEAAAELRLVIKERGVDDRHLIIAGGRPTTVKTRIVAQGQHIARLDQEETAYINDDTSARMESEIIGLLPQVDVLVLSDYGKGTLSPTLLKNVIAAAKELHRPILIDPKGRDYARYAGATLLTPNRAEAAQACGLDAFDKDAPARAGRQLLKEMDIEALLITQGEDGMTLFRRERAPAHFPARARQVFDVTGAGDTVIATLALALGSGASLSDAAHLANLAAGLVVEQVGTTVLTCEYLSQHLSEEETHSVRGLASGRL